MSLRILGCILAIFLGAQALPQRQRESSDFNYNGKPGEKALRSLDQISLQDGTIRGRSSYTDSYGNPVAYDSLDVVNAQKPSNNKDNPHQYVIPGYASGILNPHEIPTRSSDNDEGRTINDDKIHFVDPLNQNSFGNEPSTSLTVPGINLDSQVPIDIPRPNIDLPETPIDDSSNIHPLQPSLDPILPNTPPSTILEVPIEQGSNKPPFLVGLAPPQILANDGVEIPRPNLDAHETPIDDSSNALNQGLLPPTSAPTNFNAQGTNAFSNPNGPVVITDDQIVFAPKPVNGLLPPKDPLPTDFNFQAGPSVNNVLPTLAPSSKFSGNFAGTIGGGITTTAVPILQIPVQVIHSPNDVKINKYTGSFGGSPGILASNNQVDHVIPTQTTKVQPTISTTFNNILPTRSTVQNKFTGSFGGSLGVLSPNVSGPIGVPSTIQTITSTPNIQKNNLPSLTNKKVSLTFGGPEGVLRPYDNLQKK